MKLALALLALFVAASGASQAQPADSPNELNLVCDIGAASFVPVETSAATASDNQGNRASAYGVRKEAVTVRGTAIFRLRDGRATMTIPAQFLPPIHGGSGGAFEVKDLQISAREITGKVKMNFVYTTRFRIDRLSGRMSTSGGSAGMCEPEDMAKRKF